ncbi:MAG: T9SS type A sorting domain-containing protein [Bacteroidales bacterium]|nr:T9SS type A sorting domain-containing protein [Bacteroidales bacterium]
MNRQLLFLLVLNILFINSLLSSENQQNTTHIDSIFQKNGEVYFNFNINSRAEIVSLTNVISIDNVDKNIVFAYANKLEFQEFLKLDFDFEILQSPRTKIIPKMLNVFDKEHCDNWDYYPTYELYLEMMNTFQYEFPWLCSIVNIGYSVDGRKLLFAKISSNVNVDEKKPRFMYTATMHGNETVGYVLMLRLIDYLLTNYENDDRIKNMLDNIEIWINPLANPDGTFAGGNQTVLDATRYNANYIDLNRNYPDPEAGPHPDGQQWQPETMAFMNLADSLHFVISANIHSGIEVANYPWDTWERLTADDQWWQYVCREYADTAQFFSPTGYFTSLDNGITNGYAWYTTQGSRQDYMNYFQNCREFTLELSFIKIMPAEQLESYWNFNYRSLLNYIEQVNFGFQGVVTDSLSGETVAAKIFIEDHDIDNSFVYSDLAFGNYYRPIYEGSYTISVSADNYYTKTIEGIIVNNRQTTEVNIELRENDSGIKEFVFNENFQIIPNPSFGKFNISHTLAIDLDCDLKIYSSNGELIHYSPNIVFPSKKKLFIDISNKGKGIYFLEIESDYKKAIKKIIIN